MKCRFADRQLLAHLAEGRAGGQQRVALTQLDNDLLVLEVVAPGSLPESGSSNSLFDLKVKVEPVQEGFCVEAFN